MQSIFRGGVLLAGALMMTLAAAGQQQPTSGKSYNSSFDLGVTFNLEHAQVAEAGRPDFWLKGGSVDAAATVWRGIGMAVNASGEHASNIQNGISLSKLSLMAGPRYTHDLPILHRTQLFTEGLFGAVNAFDSVFLRSTGTTSTADAFSMQLGGGVNVLVAKNFSIRALELDYVHTDLPNNAADSQNDLRIAFGAAWRFGK